MKKISMLFRKGNVLYESIPTPATEEEIEFAFNFKYLLKKQQVNTVSFKLKNGRKIFLDKLKGYSVEVFYH